MHQRFTWKGLFPCWAKHQRVAFASCNLLPKGKCPDVKVDKWRQQNKLDGGSLFRRYFGGYSTVKTNQENKMYSRDILVVIQLCTSPMIYHMPWHQTSSGIKNPNVFSKHLYRGKEIPLGGKVLMESIQIIFVFKFNWSWKSIRLTNNCRANTVEQ